MNWLKNKTYLILVAVTVTASAFAYNCSSCRSVPRNNVSENSSAQTETTPVQQRGVVSQRTDKPLLPDADLTPGDALDVTAADICVSGYSKKVRNVPESVKKQVYENYGITNKHDGEYEVDHLVSLELGGSNSIKNLWPQSYKTQPMNAHVKDSLENKLHSLVCSGQLDLKQAQHEIATNWIDAYHKYVKK